MRHLFSSILWVTVVAGMPGSGGQAAVQGTAQPSTRQQTGFLDYVFGKINPSDKDYGLAIADLRSAAVAWTVHDFYFWSNVLSLILLAGTSTGLVLVLRIQVKREFIAANLISQLWNGRVVDRKEIARRTELYNGLVDTNNKVVAGVTYSEGESRRASDQKGARLNTSAQVSKTPKPNQNSSQPSSIEVEQRMRILEVQNQALRNSERNLRERLNLVSKELEQEKRRNLTLKGM